MTGLLTADGDVQVAGANNLTAGSVAVGAAAMMVTRPGTGNALPSRAEYGKYVEE